MQKVDIESWMADYGDGLMGYAVHRVSDVSTAEDLVQESFISAWKSSLEKVPPENTKAWLFKILRNKIIDHYRKENIRDEAGNPAGKRMLELEDAFDQDRWNPDYRSGSWLEDSPAEKSELAKFIAYCISLLNGKLGEAFKLKYLDDLDAESICKELDISPSNYWVLIHRAKLQLRSCLDKNYFEEIRKHS